MSGYLPQSCAVSRSFIPCPSWNPLLGQRLSGWDGMLSTVLYLWAGVAYLGLWCCLLVLHNESASLTLVLIQRVAGVKPVGQAGWCTIENQAAYVVPGGCSFFGGVASG